MLKKTITYTDFNGVEQSDVFYFNMTAAEMVKLEFGAEGESFSDYLKKIIEAVSKPEIIAVFENIIAMSYGVRSDDGKRFIKSDALLEEFKSTAAYDALFIELSTNDGAAAEFINSVMPKLPKNLQKDSSETKDETPAYILENRAATQDEIRKMNKAELQRAMKFRSELNKAPVLDDEAEILRKQLLGE